MQAINEILKVKDIEDPLKAIKKELFYRAKKEYQGKKPFGIYWGMHTFHLKTLSDWAYVKSNAEQEYQSDLRKGKKASWFKIFIGSLKVQRWHR